MTNEKNALIVSADNFEDSELLVPMYRLLEAGYQVDLAAPKKGRIKGKHGYEVEAGLTIEEARDRGACGWRILVLPGGKAPEALRKLPAALDLARDFASSGVPIAAICHGPQTLISAGLMSGRKATAYKSVQPELKMAGADVLDQEVVVDGQYITSRQPSDLPAFDREIARKLGF